MNASSPPESSVLPFTYEPLQIEVTRGLFKYRAQTFPIRTISKVTAIEKRFELGTLIINGMVILFLGVPLVLSFSGWSLLGVAALGICGFNVWDIFKKHYAVIIEFLSSDEITINTKNYDLAAGLRDAIQEALSA